MPRYSYQLGGYDWELIWVSEALGEAVREEIRQYHRLPTSEWITILELVIPVCTGCRDERGNQEAHMDCGGCLHDPTDCPLCC